MAFSEDTSAMRRARGEAPGGTHRSADPRFGPLQRSAGSVVVVALSACVVLGSLGAATAGAEEGARRDEARSDSVAASVAGERAAARGPEVYAGDGCARAGSVTAGDCPTRRFGAADDPGGSPQGETAQEPTLPPEDVGGGGDGCATEGPKGSTVWATVESVTDGDTLEIRQKVRGATAVRLIGVDAPETVDPDRPVEPYGEEASAFTEDALEGERVALELGRDAKDGYGRLLAYVWTDKGMFEERLLSIGYGRLMTIAPNDDYAGCLAAAEQTAKDEGIGLWANDAAEEIGPPPETTSSPETTSGSPSASPSPAPRPSASTEAGGPQEDEKDSGGDGLAVGIFGFVFGSSGEKPSHGAGETNAADEAALESTAPQAATPADREYASSGAGPPTPGVRPPQTGEHTPPAAAAPEGGAPEATLGATPAASPSATPSAAPSASPSASPEASPEPKITLPETGGPPLLLLAAALLPGLFPAGLLVRAGCRRAREAGRRRETGGL